MKRALALVVIAACGGPTQQQLAETPSATSRAVPGEAPPASTSDKDRERSVQQFDDMQTTQNAYREANDNPAAAPEPVTQPPANQAVAQPPPTTLPKPKKAPVEQAPK